VRWLADECVAASVVARMREAGHDVVYVAEIDPSAPDSQVCRLAAREQGLLLTEDRDFGELVFRWRQAAPGIVLLRIVSESRALKWPRLAATIERYGEALFGRYTVVEDARIRSRPLI
jgi:predicted nuclease of predicted toxin-antitoxin system